MGISTARDATTASARTTNRLAWVSASLSAFVVSVNLSVMSVAFDALGSSFPDAKLSTLGWVLSVYTIVFGAFLVPAGRLADHLGRRRLFLTGLVIFSIASLTAAVAPAVWVVIAGRVGQGIGAACLVPSTLGLLLDALPVERRASATAFYSVLSSLGGVAGPTVGAYLVQHGGWRAAFYVAPVFAIGSWITGWKSLPENRVQREGPLPDLVGAVLVIVALSALSFGILQSRDWGWTSPEVIGSLVLAVAVVPVFFTRCARHPVPVLPIQLTRFRSFSWANLASALYGMATGALLFGIVRFLRQGWDYSITNSGAGLLPLAIASMATSFFAGRLGNRFGERAVAAPSCVIIAGGLAMLAWRLGPEPAFWSDWVPGAAVIGFGMGTSYAMVGAACVREVDRKDLSVASAANRMTLQIGNAIGIALTIAIIGDAKGHAIIDPMRHAFMVMAVLALGVAASMWRTGRRQLSAG
jgi:EmrB/QacA subfamily drug resistance transporter